MIRQQRTLPGPSDENGCRYYSSSRRQCKAFADYLARDSSVAVRGGIDEMAICWLFSVRTTFPVVIFLALLGAQWLAQAPSPDSLKPKIFVLYVAPVDLSQEPRAVWQRDATASVRQAACSLERLCANLRICQGLVENRHNKHW